MAAPARARPAAHRQPPGAGGRRLHRLARRGGRRAALHGRRAGARRCGLPDGAARLARRSAGCAGRPARWRARGLPARPESAGRPGGRRVLWPPFAAHARHRHHGHQWQNLQRLVAGGGALASRFTIRSGAACAESMRLCGHFGHGPAGPLAGHGPDHARPRAAASRAAPHAGRRRALVRDGGFFHRPGRAPHGRAGRARGRVHQLHARPSGLARQHAGLLAGQGRAVCLARPASGRHQPGRPARPRAGRSHRPARRGRVGLRVVPGRRSARRRRAPVGQRAGAAPARAGLHRARSRQRPRAANRAGGRLQRQQCAGRDGRHARAGRAAGRRRACVQPPARRAGPHGADCRGRPAAGRGGLRPHARRAGKSPASLASAGGGARRAALGRVRLRRQPRQKQAPADGRGRRAAGR